MIITRYDSEYLQFIPENLKESSGLSKFPGFLRRDVSYVCPAILPIVYNLKVRLSKSFNIKVSSELSHWLSDEFILDPLPEDFKYHTQPKDFQDIALRYLNTLGSAGILLEPGMGKTKVILDYIFLKKFSKALIICPLALLFVWEEEILKHRPELSYHLIQSTNWEKESEKSEDKTVIITNYNKAVILEEEIKRIPIQYIHLDEFLIKDPNSDRTKAMTRLSKRIPFRSGGSGTLINNSPLETYSPIRFLQPSLTGESLTKFKNRYQVSKSWINPNTNKTVNIPIYFKDIPEIKSIIDSCCIVMTKDKWLKLPKKIFKDYHVELAPQQKEKYDCLARNYRVDFQDISVEVNSPLTMLSKLYQISQGFLYGNSETDEEVDDSLFTSNETSEISKKIVYFDESPKIGLLNKLINTELKNEKFLLWFNLNGEFYLIKQLLERLGINFLVIRGGEKSIGKKVKEFNENPFIQVLLCQAKSVNYGITVLGSKPEELEKRHLEMLPEINTRVHIEVFFSINFSLEVYLQQQDRIHRLGQELECLYYRLFTNSSIEIKIRHSIDNKLEIKTELLKDIKDITSTN